MAIQTEADPQEAKEESPESALTPKYGTPQMDNPPTETWENAIGPVLMAQERAKETDSPAQALGIEGQVVETGDIREALEEMGREFSRRRRKGISSDRGRGGSEEREIHPGPPGNGIT